ncbi:MAG: IPT/TIG domain-containing protein, partial [SAR324 cluster bacterium]|nr:IPT/TIG domain-containing protein [SAR324 cluster bacterium]
SYYFRFPTAKNQNNHIEISELEIITDDVTKGTGGPEPSGRPPINDETFDKIDDYHMVAIDGSGGKHGAGGGGYWHNLSFEAQKNIDKKFILELPGDLDLKKFETGLPEIYQSFVSDLNNMKNNAFLTRLWDTDLERFMRFYNMGGRNEVVSFSDNYWGTDSPILVGAMIYDFNEDFNRGPIFYEPVLKSASPKMYPFVEDITITTDSITDQSLRSGAPKQVSTERVKFTLKYNRPMDSNIDPKVHFGPAPPYTDNTVFAVDGGWQNSKEWTGEFSINPGSGDGFQMMHVYGGAAADDAWLVPARDEGRFRFQILSVGAASLTLKVVGHEGYNDVNWLQDDFETLAGYNLYRSETESGEYKRINDSLISIKTNRFIDSNVQPGKKYFYKFTVVQTDQRESNFSNSSSAVPKDTISPVIIHESRKTATANMPLTLFAEVSDNVFVQSVNLLYRRIGNSDFKSIQMKNTTGQRYSASIVASDVVLPGVEYYIEASDGVGTSSSGLALSPYKVEAIDTPFITSTTPIIGPGTGGTTITITGGNFVPETVVYFGDELATDVVVDGRTKITCKTPKHFADTVNILVENPGLKQFSLPRGFTFESTEARVRIPNQIAPQFARVVVPIRASNISGLTAADFKVDYDPYVLTPVDISTGEKFSGWNLASNIDSLSDLKYKLVNHITFDETFMDSSGRGNHAFRDINYDNWSFTSEKGGIFTKVIEGQKYSFGNLDFVTGKVGTHAIGGNFRTTDYVSLGRPDDLNLSQDIDFSLSLWLKTTGTILESTAPAIFSNDYLTLRTLKSKGQGDVTSVDWVLVGANGGRASGETKAGPNIDDHEWHHIAFIYDRSNKVYTYVDGKKVGEWDVPDKLDITTPLDGAFNLGQVGSGNQSNSLKVHFDDLALWRRAINAKEVETIYASGNEGLDISGAGGALQHKEAKTLSVSLASNGGSFTGSGNLVNVEFLVIGKAGTQSPLYASGITVREFTGIGGSKVRNLVSSPKFPDKPDLTAKALYTEWPPGDASGGLPPDRYKDNYGVQMLGYIHPPETGEYIFYISSDDNGELYLSTDENPANKKLIATEPHWNNRREWVSEWNRYKVGPRVDNDQWHQMAFTRKKGGDVSVYFDGKKVGTSSAQHLVNLSNADLELMLNQDGTGDYYAHAAASYDDVGIWARELSQQDIEKLYNQGKQGSSLNSDTVGLKDSLVAHLGFDDKLDDSTGNANNGILANTAVDVSSPLNDIVATSDNSPNGETVEFAIDDNPGTKYLNFDKLNAGLTITLDEASSLTGLGFISANDVPARDPASYKLTGSNDGVTFETVSEGSVPDFFERFQRREIKFDAKSKAYSTYRLIFPTVVDASSANSVQIAEVQFLGAESSANYIPGKIGSKAIKFGHGEYMKFGKDGKGIDFSESFSVSLWVKTNGWQDDPAIISNKNWNDGWNQGWVLAFTDDGSFKFNANELENSSRIDISAQTSRNANQSEPVRLEKGKAYYIEALMKEGGGGDNLAVTWQMPGDPKPTNRTTKPISGTHLSPWSLDEEGNPITPSQLKNKELSTNIKLSKALLNEGRINVAINDGSLQVQGGTSISGKIYHWKTLAQVRNTTVRLNVGGFDDQGYFSKLLDIKNTGDTGAYGFS